MVDEEPHELLGLRDGGGVFESAALEVDERLAAQSYRIRRRFPLLRGHRAAFDHVKVLALGRDRRIQSR